MIHLLDLSDLCLCRVFALSDWRDYRSLALTCRRLGVVARMMQSMSKDHWRRKSFWVFLELILYSVNRNDYDAAMRTALCYRTSIEEVLSRYMKLSFALNYEMLRASALDQNTRHVLSIILTSADRLMLGRIACHVDNYFVFNFEEKVKIALEWDCSPVEFDVAAAEPMQNIRTLKLSRVDCTAGDASVVDYNLNHWFPLIRDHVDLKLTLQQVLSDLALGADGNIVSQFRLENEKTKIYVTNVAASEVEVVRSGISRVFDRLIGQAENAPKLSGFLNVLRKCCQRLSVQEACTFLFDLYTNAMPFFSVADCFSYGELLGYLPLIRPLLLNVRFSRRQCICSPENITEVISLEFPGGDLVSLTSSTWDAQLEVKSRSSHCKRHALARVVESFVAKIFTEEELCRVPEISERFVYTLFKNLLLWPEMSTSLNRLNME